MPSRKLPYNVPNHLMMSRRIAALALVIFLSSQLFASHSKKHVTKKMPPADPVCDAIELPATSLQKPPLSGLKQQQLDDALLDATEDNKLEVLKELLAK